MSLPLVAIVGRPNVGKSSLFNWLAGKRISIVDPTAGVTRDRVTTVIAVGDRFCELIDTGGMGIKDVDDLTDDIEQQIRYAIDSASVIVFVVDVRDGVAPLDQEVADRLRPLGKAIVFVANKADTDKIAANATELFRLGFGEPLCVSADQKLGKQDLIDAIAARLPADVGDAPPSDAALKLAIVGRRNVGKSTFINSLAQANRVIVSEVPGTTRDSIDVRFERDGKTFVAIDTAGVQKKTSFASGIEFYSSHRAERSVRRADVVLHFFDARHRVGRVDKQLAGYIVENDKPAIFVVNKWDLVKAQFPTEKMGAYIRSTFPMLEHVPIAFITAKKGKNTLRLLQLAIQLHKQAGTRVNTGDLNRVIRTAIETNAPPMRTSKTPKVFYATQIGVYPPTIVLFTNGPELFEDTYVRYLTRVLRDHFPFAEVSIKLVLRAKGEGSSRTSPLPEVENHSHTEAVNDTLDSSDEIPVLREKEKPAKNPKRITAELINEPAPAEPLKAPKNRKKKAQNSETWDV